MSVATTQAANPYIHCTWRLRRAACPTLRPTRADPSRVPLPGAVIRPQSAAQAFGKALRSATAGDAATARFPLDSRFPRTLRQHLGDARLQSPTCTLVPQEPGDRPDLFRTSDYAILTLDPLGSRENLDGR